MASIPRDIRTIQDLNADRTTLVPLHTGPHVFPNNYLFSKLLRHARRNRLAIRDVNIGIEKTYGQLLSDVLSLRAHLEVSLPEKVLESIRKGDEVYIGVLSEGGYEFAVAVLTVLALGAAVVPMSK
jgi:malonyl-CoA/methylmalonyl-CoA synthetase